MFLSAFDFSRAKKSCFAVFFFLSSAQQMFTISSNTQHRGRSKNVKNEEGEGENEENDSGSTKNVKYDARMPNMYDGKIDFARLSVDAK